MTLKLRLSLPVCALLVSEYACAQPSSAFLNVAAERLYLSLDFEKSGERDSHGYFTARLNVKQTL